ncbi:DUF222 domain-containing protein [Blastococcus sp. SYSU D00695]
MYEIGWVDEGGVESLVEVALATRLRALPARIDVRRPRGVWIVDAVHGRRGCGPVRPVAGSAGPGERPEVLSRPDVPPQESGSGRVAEVPDDPRARLLDEGARWLDVAVETERGLAQLAGARVRALAAFAGCRPASWDRQPGERGAASVVTRASRPAALTAVSEWAVAEIAARLQVSTSAAATLLVEAVEMAEHLPGTLAALEAGDITWAQARALVELVRPVAADKKSAVEARVLPRAPRQTVAQLRECTRRAVARIDAEAAVRRLTAAIRGRKVSRHPAEDGMAVLSASLPAPVARACWEALRAHAVACATGEDGNPDPRSLDERMADCLADLILRPDADGRSPVQVLLTLVAGVDTLTGVGPDADEPGELDGDAVPAVLVREMAHAFRLLPRPGVEPHRRPTSLAPEPVAALERGVRVATGDAGVVPAPAEALASTGGAARAAEAASTGGADGAEGAASTGGADGAEQDIAQLGLAQLLDLRRLEGAALAERPRIAVTEKLTGCLLALTNTVELSSAASEGRGLGPPGETAGYRPSRPLDRFVRLRDRRCRFPGCRARARRGDLDHRVPHPHGPTAHHNLESLCEHHHRLSHQAPGWRLQGAPGDGLVWVLPGGTTITTVPPRFGTDGSQPSSTGGSERGPATDWRRLSPTERRERLRELVCGRPAARRDGPAPPF